MILNNTIIVLALLPLFSANPQNSTNASPKKAKRTLSDQVYSNGDAKAVLFYMENPQTAEVPELQASASSSGLRNFYSAPAKPLALVSVQQPIQVFEQDSPKQVAEQQVLYEFQQTPTNAVSNVHVKQLFQPSIEHSSPNPLYQSQSGDQLPTTQPLGSIHASNPIITANQPFFRSQSSQAVGLTSGSSHYPATSATIISPVHHNLYTNHGLNSPPFSYHNSFLSEPQQFQNTQINPKHLPGKYIYLNGKIVYSPTHIIPQGKIPPNSVYHKGVYHNQQKLPLINYSQRHNPSAVPQGHINENVGVVHGSAQQGHVHGSHSHHGAKPYGKSNPPGYLPPITHNRFQAPKQLHPIDKPSAPLQQEEAEEEEEQLENEEEEDEAEDDEEDAATENQEDERDHEEHEEDDTYGYETFPFEEDDYLNEDENHYFKAPKYRKNKGRGRNLNDEPENDHDDREDTKRGASKLHSKYHNHPNHRRRNRNLPKYETGENYGYYEGYSSNSKYKSPKHGKKSSRKQKHEKPIKKYRKVKFSKLNGSKPKVESIIEGRFSENIPITHKQKVYKERWYVTKDIGGGPSKNIKTIK